MHWSGLEWVRAIWRGLKWVDVSWSRLECPGVAWSGLEVGVAWSELEHKSMCKALSICAQTHSRLLQPTPGHFNPLQCTSGYSTHSDHFSPVHVVLTHFRSLHLLQTTLKTQQNAIRNHSWLCNRLQKIFEFSFFLF